MVEVFKTNVQKQKQITLQTALSEQFPHFRINFDLDDCDKILRVEGQNIPSEKIIQLLNKYNCICEVLD